MANGATRIALAKVQMKKASGNTEHAELKSLYDNKKKGKAEKFPLKAGASEHNHSN